ncbi:imidazoleglycerol-phosphate dehydratase HisB [Haloquadratum walsbyi]|jgi:imidazoleglycerol-phosphate dehydratase (EC 4.2.1.19)|uniref:Imidazoleglycerol-phosphate dehydratase n=1 Tax=Haloquadratum walsbyi J07HQW2 TaxID=1238425 RepID=U1NFT9_9EURY|nr:imidazoleglycerol-phosphate dehydratase HisB [Haloquadratum walsbyi]ERG95955.1 MAG: Imidazoleglycerol-phosphate dehydratase [Haloquadratum walsbyi J07HQW2]
MTEGTEASASEASTDDRTAAISRETAETTIDVTLAIDGDGDATVDTGIGFFDHMLETFAKHGLFNVTVHCDGDLSIDDHHTVEDIGIVLGESFNKALGEKRGIVRYADRSIPLDESVATVIADISGRPHFEFSGSFSQPQVGEFTSDMARHFAYSLTMHSEITLHASVKGVNAHHEIEALFKSLARTLDEATQIDPRRSDTPSTKGKL